MKIRSDLKKKILLILLGGIALGLATSPRSQRIIFRKLSWEWKMIDRERFKRVARELKKDRFVSYCDDEWWNAKLTSSGKILAKEIDISNIKLKILKKWDGKWRMVLFDIPEKNRAGRNALRQKIKELGFTELQKSVFVYPYPCRKEIDEVIKFFRLEKFVQQCMVYGLNEFINRKLIKKFSL
jgi:CRISPR-associated endonuclease Cas2